MANRAAQQQSAQANQTRPASTVNRTQQQPAQANQTRPAGTVNRAAQQQSAQANQTRPTGMVNRAQQQSAQVNQTRPTGAVNRAQQQSAQANQTRPTGMVNRAQQQSGVITSPKTSNKDNGVSLELSSKAQALTTMSPMSEQTGDSEFDKLRTKKKSDEEIITDYMDRRKAPRNSDRRQSKRFVEDNNTLTGINLRKNFGSKEIVRGVGFSMKGGDVAGLLGPNGAGKTTIFYMIVGFYKPTTGDIKLNGVSITSGPMYRRARMGIAYLPQEASIFRKLTVEQNIWAILESRRDFTKAQKKNKLDELINDFGIGRIRKQFGYTLSGGERRRTEIARALAIDPKFLLLDEPFAGIDPIAVYEIKQIIKRLSKSGIGILITDHNVRDTLEITSDAFIINHGSIVARGDRDHILKNQTVRDVYLGSDFKM
jgi:lipopolysaccharide export system ATP-binding protein